MILNRVVELQAHTVIRKITETQAEKEAPLEIFWSDLC